MQRHGQTAFDAFGALATSLANPRPGWLVVCSLDYLACKSACEWAMPRGFAANTVGMPPVEYQHSSRRGGRYPAEAISVAAKRLGLGTGA
jgi:hypothetical protein